LFLADARRERKRVQYIERIKDWSFELEWNVDRLKELGMHTWNSSWSVGALPCYQASKENARPKPGFDGGDPGSGRDHIMISLVLQSLR